MPANPVASVPLYLRKTGEGVPRGEPGDWYWLRHEPGHCYVGWSNCDGRHLCVVLPDGHHWDVDSRCSNCTLRSDTTHRCWVRTGEPPAVTAGKTGRTCAAGAGSIQTARWHGFLDEGWLCLARGQHPAQPPAQSPARPQAQAQPQPQPQPQSPQPKEGSTMAEETTAPAETKPEAPAQTPAPAPTTKDEAKTKVLETLRHPEAHKDHNSLFHRLAEDLEHLFKHL